jgi:hypothetical protein
MSSRNYVSLGLSIGAVALTAALIVRAQEQKKPEHMTHQQMEEMNKRGDQVMGFDHLKTTHHFILASDGGSIRIQANDKKDDGSRDQIRGHLQHIAVMFGEGNFKAPMLIHGYTPPGVDVMEKLKSEISYRYEETKQGALIRISTKNADALKAVHEFLRYQIKEHMTGDPLEAP